MSVPRLAFSLFSLVACGGFAHAQPLRFLARPYTGFEGDEFSFRFLDSTSTVPLASIRSWRWDFNNDGTWDQQSTVGQNGVVADDLLSTTWIAPFDASLDTDRDGVITYEPRLQITKTDGTIVENPVRGITEDVYGTDGQIDRFVTVKRRSIASNVLRVNFSANPRLAEAGTLIRFYSDVALLNGNAGTLTYAWDLDGDGDTDSDAANPTFTYPGVTNPTRFPVSLTVAYTVTGGPAYTVGGTNVQNGGTLKETKRDFIQIQQTPARLAYGRAYRRGFPELYGWDDILKAYSARGPGNNQYVYYNHFEQAYFDQQTILTATPGDTAARSLLAESVNELLQGQLLVGNQRLIDALRVKYPRMAAIDPNNPPERLSTPPGVREETAAIDVAMLDYQAPLHYAAAAIARYGPEVLRSKAAAGAEPFPDFPLYVSFTDPSLSQSPIPIKNEYWQLTTSLDRLALGRVEKAKKLYRLSAKDDTALTEAKEEAKIAGTQSYLGMALLAAAQSEPDFAGNQGNSLLAHVKNARDLFERINAGLNPLGNDGSFIPNESFAATYQDAQEAVADAREAEVNARQEERTFDQYQAELRNEHQRQRDAYITPLRLLTGEDPALYNNLQTADDQRDYRAVINSRVDALIEDYPNGDPAIVGELGNAVIGLLDSKQALKQSVNDIENLYARVDLAKWANQKSNINIEGFSKQFQNIDLLSGIVDGAVAASQAKLPWDKVIAASGGVVKGILSQQRTVIQTLQTIAINNVAMEKETQGLLLEAGNLGIAIDRSKNAVAQAQLSLDNQLTRMDRLIEDLANARDTAAPLYFSDPSFRIVVSDALRRAEAELDYAVDRLFRLAKTLEYEWTEGYRNPLIIPVNSYEPASLENPLFDQFTETDSLFFIRGADEAKDYLDALRAWDSKLRRINVTSVRGPNNSGPISAEPISLREQMLNFRPDATRGYTLNETIRDFRNFLETRRVPNRYNPQNPSLEIDLQTTIEDNRYFPATGSRWNMRLDSISAEVYAESGFNTSQVIEIDLIQTGVVSLRRYWAEPPDADDVMKLTFNADNLDRTAFAIAFPAKVNGATGNRPPTEFINYGLKGRPVAATKWILRINTENPANRNIDFSKIKDIVLRFTYTYGNPPEFPGF